MAYSDYFALQEAYYAVTSKISIEDPKNRWQDTYPHATFVEMLKKAAKMLSRPDGNSNAAKPLWVHGAYGTGKSRIVWTLRELLTCSPEELQAYFNDYAELRDEKELREKLLGIKNGDKIVAAMRYSSGEIHGLDGLVMAIYTSVCEALEARGMDPLAENSLTGAMLKWLDDPVNQNILTQILTAAPYCHNGNLPKSGQEVRSALLAEGRHGNLIEELMRIGRERHILGISFDIQNLCSWLKEVIDKNKLTGLVFIFDEFSDFLMYHHGIYSSIQELAHLSQRVPFYFIIVTHFSESLFPQDNPAARVMMDRFNLHAISLPDYTAFKLLGHALKVRDGMEREWGEFRDDLNDRLENARRGVSKMVPALEQNDFKNILPIHPFAALILKNVASIFDSNQRSMFDFIAVDQEDTRAFQWFIHQYGPEDAAILGVDHLWNYFYDSGKGNAGLGQQNLRGQAREILGAYPQLEAKIKKDGSDSHTLDLKLRVLKTVVILQALRAVSPQINFFHATKDILDIAFNGISELENGQGLTVLDALISDKILFLDNDIYQIPMGHAVDQVEILKNVDIVRNTITTTSLISAFNPWEVLPANKALETRLEIRKASAPDFSKTLNSLIAQENTGWKIKTVLLFARTGLEAVQLAEQLKKACADPRASNIYFIDASGTNMSEDQFDELVLARGRQRYFSGKNEAQARIEAQVAERVLQAWRANIANGKFVLYSAKFPEGYICHTGDDLVNRLKAVVTRQFPACCDFFDGVVDPHFRGPNLNAIKAGLGLNVSQPQISKQQADRLLSKVHVDNYWTVVPDHPLSLLKNELDKMARRAFAADGPGQLGIKKIVDTFLEKGFMPTVLSSYLTGFLLRDYAGPQYRYSDGNTGDVMTPERLAEMIRDYYQKLGSPALNYREQYIEVLTKEQRAFVDLCQKIFNLQGNESLENIALNIADIVKNWGYPLWVLKELPEAVSLEDYVTDFAALLNPQANGASGHGQVASSIGKMILKSPEAEAGLKDLFKQENLEKGMRQWLGIWEGGELCALAEEIHVEDLLRDVRACFGADGAWLWDKATGEEAIKSLLQGYRLAAQSIRQGFLTHAASKNQCLEGWRQKVMLLHIPAEVLQDRYPDQKQLLNIFKDLAKNGLLVPSKENKLYEAIINNTGRLQEIFANSRDNFKTIYAPLLNGMADDDKNSLYNKLPGSSFFEDRDIFEKELKTRAEELASKLKRNELVKIWQENTGEITPMNLSKLLRTPLKIMLGDIFAEGEFKAAVNACEAINNPNSQENEIVNAIAFWQAHMDSFAKLVDQEQADKSFTEKIIGNYKTLLGDAQKVRNALANRYGNDAWSWLDNPGWMQVVKEVAEQEYKNNAKERLARKIAMLTPEDAKKLLQDMAENDFEVALKILEIQ